MISKIKDIEKRLIRLGYEQKKHTNSHTGFSKKGSPNVVIPKRKSKDLIKPTYFSILKQLGISHAQFIRL